MKYYNWRDSSAVPMYATKPGLNSQKPHGRKKELTYTSGLLI